MTVLTEAWLAGLIWHINLKTEPRALSACTASSTEHASDRARRSGVYPGGGREEGIPGRREAYSPGSREVAIPGPGPLALVPPSLSSSFDGQMGLLLSLMR